MFDHLDPSMVPLLQLPLPERIKSCLEDRWVEYPQATATLRVLDELIDHPKTHRGRCLLVTGPSNSGKSALLQECRRRHQNRIGEDGTMAFSIASIQTPGKPNESGVISEMLLAVKIKHPIRHGPALKRPVLLQAVEQLNMKALFMDEFNHVNEAGKEAAPLLGFLMNFADGTGVKVVAFGTEKATNALLIDPQFYTRFKIIELDQWTLNSVYLGFLAGYERVLPLARPSGLATKELAPEIFRLAGASTLTSFVSLGGTVEVLKGLSAFALKNGQECIDATTLKGWKAENAVFLSP